MMTNKYESDTIRFFRWLDEQLANERPAERRMLGPDEMTPEQHAAVALAMAERLREIERREPLGPDFYLADPTTAIVPGVVRKTDDGREWVQFGGIDYWYLVRGHVPEPESGDYIYAVCDAEGRPLGSWYDGPLYLIYTPPRGTRPGRWGANCTNTGRALTAELWPELRK